MFFKTRSLLLASCALLTGGMALAGPDDHAARHGGIIVPGKVFDLEVVAKPDSLHVHVSDHGKPVKLDGAKGKVTLLNGSDKTDIELGVAGDRLEAKGSFKVQKGTKGIASVTLQGKPAVAARFEIR